jgi:hypothetical protein
MPYVHSGGSMSSSKQTPHQPPHTLPAPRSGLELHSIVTPRGFQRFRARVAQATFNLLPSLGCSTRWGGHNFSHGLRFDSCRYLTTKSAAFNFFCAPRPALSIEIQKSDLGNALLPAGRHARRVKKMRGWYV